jgi:hypothetical protein
MCINKRRCECCMKHSLASAFASFWKNVLELHTPHKMTGFYPVERCSERSYLRRVTVILYYKKNENFLLPGKLVSRLFKYYHLVDVSLKIIKI